MDPKQLLDHFSTHLKNVIAKAISVSASFSHNEVTPLHLLLAITHERGSIGEQLLKRAGIESEKVLNELKKIRKILPEMEARSRAAVATLPELNKDSKRILEKAMLTGYDYEHAHIGTEHLLYGILESKNLQTKTLFTETQKKDILEQLETIFASTNKFPDVQEIAEAMHALDELDDQRNSIVKTDTSSSNGPLTKNNKKQTRKNTGNTAIDMFTVELTDEDVQSGIDPVIGREKEIDRIIHVLSRRNKNNPILVGEPGVGKTAIVEGIAKRISEGKVPSVLQNKKIFAVDLTLLVAGTIYRGEFEARIKQLIDEVSSRSDYMLFIDEIHNIIGTGSNQGTMDAANILKPALARGKLRCIGATTHEEYKKYVTSDPALERRFQSITIDEPSREDAISILKGIKKYYNEFHDVTISDDAIETAVDFSMRYIHDNFLPDKAIDLIDEASAAVRTKKKITTTQKKQMELRKELESIRKEKQSAIDDENLNKASALKKRFDTLEKKVFLLEKQIKKTKQPIKTKITRNDIIEVLSSRLNINVELLEKNKWEQLATLPERLETHIVGQSHVLNTVTRSLKQAYLGMKKNNQPTCSLLFVGPSGVGKTELAKVLAKELYHNEKAFIRIDMSEFAEGHGVSKLLGSPAGYIGYKDRNRFLDALRDHPYSVVLFDEIDKAHPDVSKLLLQILDEGTLTDSNGRKVHFNNTTIILTSNLGSEYYKSTGLGFGSNSKKEAHDTKERDNAIHFKLKEEFGSALIGRLNNICIFNPLSDIHIQDIIQKNLERINKQLKKDRDLTLKISKKALAELIKESKNDDSGARNIERIVQNVIQDLLIDILQTKDQKKKIYELERTKQIYTLK